MQKVAILGSTGSIGVSTLDVISHHLDRFEVFALSAHKRWQALLPQIEAFNPQYAVVVDEQAALALRQALAESPKTAKTTVLSGSQALDEVAKDSECDTVVAAIVGAAGLSSTMSAVLAGKRVLLANKESLVMAGRLCMDAAEQAGATLLPVDSEHNAIFQCLPPDFKTLKQAGIRRLLLTGSGGPFRNCALEDLRHVTPEQACNHPNWSMGQKISVDSATMMNKGLEFIEACWLFKAQPQEIEVVVHPQSIIHSMVEYLDGSVLAQMGQPDMRTPIANCLGWPERIESKVPALDFTQLQALEFQAPDYQRFPCLSLAIKAMKDGGSLAIAVNAANEVAVEAFLNKRLGFLQIAQTVAEVVESWSLGEPDSLDAVIHADSQARERAEHFIRSLNC